MNHSLLAARRLAAVLIVAALLPAAVAAQTPPDSVAAPVAPPAPREVTMLQGGAMGELLSIYVPRTELEIRTSMGFARDLAVTTLREIETARRLAMESEGRLRVIKEEIETTKVRRDIAKKSKDEAQKSQLDDVVKRQERERDYLQRLFEAMRADSERLDADRAAADSWVKSLEEESLVARRQSEIGVREPTPDEAADYRVRLRRMLDAQKQASERWEEASALRKQVAERRIKQLEALSKISK